MRPTIAQQSIVVPSLFALVLFGSCFATFLRFG